MPARLAKQGCPWKDLWQRNSRIFFCGKSRCLEAQMSKTSEIPGSKKPVFHGLASAHTDRGQMAPGTPQENLSPWADARAPPLQQTVCSARRGKNGVLHHFSSLRTGLEGAFGRAIGALEERFLPSGGLSLAPASGVPPFELVFGLNWPQGSHKLEPPLGRACLRIWQNKVVLEKLCASATRSFFSGPEVAVLKPE